MMLDIDLVSDAFLIENDPDLWKAERWASDVCKIRVIETPVGAYGALDQGFGTTYFDIGDWLLKIRPFRQVVVLSKSMIQSLEEEDEDSENDE